MRLDLSLMNEVLEDQHITILQNTNFAWEYVLGNGTDTDISDTIYGVSLMVQNGGCIKQRHNFLVIDYGNSKIYTLENDEAVIKLYNSLVLPAGQNLQLYY